VTYAINREHPFVAALESVVPESSLSLFQKFLQTLERTFPFDALYADMASERRPDAAESTSKTSEELYDLATRLLDVIGCDSEAASRFLENLTSIEPFSRFPDESHKLIEKLEYVYRERKTD
jgi:hypothetical protein